MGNIICPFCDKEFEGDPWEGGECPGCEESYYWSEEYDAETNDVWPAINWQRFDDEYFERLKQERKENK